MPEGEAARAGFTRFAAALSPSLEGQPELAARDRRRAYCSAGQGVAGFLALDSLSRAHDQHVVGNVGAVIRSAVSCLAGSRNRRDLPAAPRQTGPMGPVCCPISEGASAGSGQPRPSTRRAGCALSAIPDLAQSRAEVAWSTAKEVKPSRNGRRCSY